MKRAGVPTTSYQNFLLELKEEYPILSAVRTTDFIGKETRSMDETDGLEIYRKLQYYQLFDWEEEAYE